MKKTNFFPAIICLAIAFVFASTGNLHAQLYDTEEVSMMKGVSKHIKNGWSVDPIFTVAETDNEGVDYSMDRFDYRIPGVIDGMYAYKRGEGKIDLTINHELRDERGYPYMLENGTELTGARITKMRIVEKNGKRRVKSAGLAYSKIIDRYYQEVTDAAQLNEGANPGSLDGMDRLCSAGGIEKGKFGFEDEAFLTGEETGNGQEFILDVKKEVLYCAPAMGRAAWESATVMNNFYSNKVVVLIGDDRGGAPLLLYIGEKNASFSPDAPNFLKRNGLAKGSLFAWVADSGETTPDQWNGTGTTRTGKFIRINHYQPENAGAEGFDLAGYADNDTQDALAEEVGNFKFSRPEDVATNPNDGTQAVMASTGRESLFPGDAWGTTYLINFRTLPYLFAMYSPLELIDTLPADLTVLYDGDDAGAGQFESPDFGMRSPDNLEWADDGYIYLNEDRSIGDFCGESGVEASVWQLNPNTYDLTRILEMDRNAVPFNQNDSDPDDCGDWESSGIIDVSSMFDTKRNETLLLLNVQAHSVDNAQDPDSPIGGDDDLSEGGQILFASKRMKRITTKNTTQGSNELTPSQLEEKESFVYPNPAIDILNLKSTADIQLFDINGILVLEQANTKSVNVSSLKKGYYILKTGEGISHNVIIK